MWFKQRMAPKYIAPRQKKEHIIPTMLKLTVAITWKSFVSCFITAMSPETASIALRSWFKSSRYEVAVRPIRELVPVEETGRRIA